MLDDDAEDRRRLLRRIARALDLSVAQLIAPSDDRGEVGDEDERTEQVTELLRLFQSIRNPQSRRRCVAFVRNAAR